MSVTIEKAKSIADLEVALEPTPRDVLKAQLDHALRVIFRETPEVNVIFLRGYTPDFNDGDPCTHGQGTACVQEYEWSEGGVGHLFDFVDIGDGEYAPDPEAVAEWEEEHDVELPKVTAPYFNPRWSKGPDPRTPAQVKMGRVAGLLWNMRDLFYRIYNTNWAIAIVRTGPDTYKLEKEHYHCGH